MVLGATVEMPFLDSWVTLLWTNTEAALAQTMRRDAIS